MEAVEALAGLHAQEPKPPFLALHARLRGFAPDALGDAIRSGELVRGTLMRGTLHLVTPADFAAWRTLLSSDEEQVKKVLGARAEGLDAARVLPVARELLEAEPRTFTALRAALVERFPGVHERALGFCARMLLPLTMVPSDDRWGYPRDAPFAVHPVAPAPATDAGREALVLRYLAAFGPASVADAQAWSGLKGLKPAFEALRDRLLTFRLEGGRRELFDLPDAPRPDPETPAPPRLLGEFDQLLLAHDDRSRVIADEHRPLVTTKNLRVKAVFLLDGVVAGTWTSEVTRGAATLTLEPFAGTLPRGAKGPLSDEAERILRWLEPDAKRYAVAV